MSHTQIPLISQVLTQLVHITTGSIDRMARRVASCVARRAHALEIVVNPIGDICSMAILNCCMRSIVKPSAVVDEYRSCAGYHIVRVQIGDGEPTLTSTFTSAG